jgi:L-proline amide hydrolase
MAWRGHETWYRIVGDLDPEAECTPVVICHGGPGAAHDYTEPIADLSRYGRACMLYDQLGCGLSEHLPDAPADFWTVELFKDELVELTRHLVHRPVLRVRIWAADDHGRRGAAQARFTPVLGLLV